MPRARKFCGRNGCRTLVTPPRKHCEACSGWATSPKTASSQATDRHHWRSVIRPAALKRDNYRCQLAIPGLCVGTATEVDHIIEVSDGGTDTLENAQSSCRRCHARKTAQHAARASHRAR
jgi:5-methylcytosine-specific restriction protein A